MSEAEFTAMSASDKAMRVHEHYGEALAVDANGQLLSRYENGIWKVITPSDFARDVAGLFQRLRAPFSSGRIASVVETLKLIIPQQEAPARRLIGFRNGVLDTKAAYSARTANRTGCAPCATWISPRRWRGNAGNPRAELLALARPGGQWQPDKT
jgi:putative DNA primase/helicase